MFGYNHDSVSYIGLLFVYRLFGFVFFISFVSLGVFHGVSYLCLKFVIKRFTLFIIFLYLFSSSATCVFRLFHGVSYLCLKFVIKRLTLFIIFLYSFSSSALSFRDVS